MGACDWTSPATIPEHSEPENELSGVFHPQENHLQKRQSLETSAKYGIFPFDPSQSQIVVPSLVDGVASPTGWHKVSGKESLTTSGNNVVAEAPSASQPSNSSLAFVYSVDDKKQNPGAYTPASITNAFVLTNIFHDMLFHYGFTPATGNFQQESFGQGRPDGDNDAIRVVVQDGARKNNAVFASAPDGKPGVMRLFLFDQTSPQRDSALDSRIVVCLFFQYLKLTFKVHELMHGVSNRLTGGAGNNNCLKEGISKGMSEGWSDMMALMFTLTSTDTRVTDQYIGAYASGKSAGIRSAPYSTNLTRNPYTYQSIEEKGLQPHSIGEIWTSILYEVYWDLVDKYGFSSNLRDESKSGKGNTMFVSVFQKTISF